MKRMFMKNLKNGMLIVALILIVKVSFAQTFSVYHYASDDSNIANPERGFYHHTETQSGSYSFLDETTLKAYRSQGITMILRMFYIDDYVSQPIDEKYLMNMQTDFNTARFAGIKMIVRFAYTQKSSAPYNDATPEWVQKHIAQLIPLLMKNSDVIAVVQAGFIGAWGEWYYTDHFSETLGNPTSTDWVNRRAVVDALLNALPEGRSVLVRTPAIKMSLVGDHIALTNGEAFTGSAKARIGHHNDCFLASDTDYGTYTDDMESEKAFLEQETNYVAMGGETCGEDVPVSECPNALEQMKRFHWSFLNKDYHGGVLNSWEQGSCMPEVFQKLGYRFRLVESSLQIESKPGGEVKFSVKLMNDGWANPYNKRAVEIILRRKSDKKLLHLPLNEDPRKWIQYDTINVDITAGIPLDAAEGEYEVIFNLPDPEPTLHSNPDFSVHLANPDVWEEETGFNKLGHTLTIAGAASVPLYDGSNFFIGASAAMVTAPPKMKATSSGEKAILYWGERGMSPYYKVIERSEDGGNFSVRTTLPPTDFVFVDQTIASSVAYRMYYVNEVGEQVSPTSEMTHVTMSARPPYYVFKTDAVIDEWEDVAPLATTLIGDKTQAYKAFLDAEKLNILFEGQVPEKYSFYFDTDNSDATGAIQNSWNYQGFNFLIRNDSLFSGNASALSFVEKVATAASDTAVEISVPLNSLHIEDGTTTLETAATLNIADTILSYPPTDSEPLKLLRQIPAPTPAWLSVDNSESLPETQLIVQWASCSGCQGYVVERSSDGTNFSTVATTGKFEYILYDNGLSKEATYYYRVYAYNDAGLSAASEIKSGKPAAVVAIEQPFQFRVSAYPNPVEQYLTLSRTKSDKKVLVRITNSAGICVNVIVMEKDQSQVTIDFSDFPKGLYLVQLSARDATLKVFKK